MKLSDQVCTIEQAKQLKELGIEQNSLFHWCEYNGYSRVMQSTLYEREMSPSIYFSAFTVAELGVMLAEIDNGNIDATGFYNWHMGFWDGIILRPNDDDYKIINNNYEEDTEAQVRAEMLIYLLENKLITAEECNQRLSA